MTKRVIIGRISGLYGIQGWVKVFSYTLPISNILHYSPWQIQQGTQWQTLTVCEGRLQGKGIIARLTGYHDRTSAMSLLGSDIVIDRRQLPPPSMGEYYWTDLIGLTVMTRDGIILGQVEDLLETGANDVLVVQGERERLIPLLFNRVVLDIDLDQQILRVDWDSEF